VSVVQPSDIGGESAHGWRQHRWRIAGLAIAALLAVGALLLWGPVGLGNGPLAAQMGATEGWGDIGQAPVGFILPMYNSGGSPATVDSVDLVGGTPYAAPRLQALAVLTSARCGGAWPARVTSVGFVMVGCGGNNRGPLVGSAIGPNTQAISAGFPAAAEAAAPRPGTCWVITEVVVHYHVGIRHYAATDPFELAVCGRGAAAQVERAMNAAEGIR
jgi:hypothetical protein